MKAFIYHHGDTDGITAGAVVYNKLIKNTDIIFSDIKTICIKNYNQEFDLSDIEFGDHVYFVDYSFTNQNNLFELTKLINMTNDTGNQRQGKYVTWIDHHKTSEDIIKEQPFFKENMNVFINTDYCGAVLSYLYMNSNLNSLDVKVDLSNPKTVKTLADGIPDFLKYVDSWDTWKHNMVNTTEFEMGKKLEDIEDPKDERYSHLLDPGYLPGINLYTTNFINRCIKNGRVIRQYSRMNSDWQIEDMSFECTINGFSCIALNGRGSSETFGDKIKKYDLCCMFYYNGDKYFYSLYSDDNGNVDTSEISKKFGGGGHPHASGFQSDKMIISKDCDISA